LGFVDHLLLISNYSKQIYRFFMAGLILQQAVRLAAAIYHNCSTVIRDLY